MKTSILLGAAQYLVYWMLVTGPLTWAQSPSNYVANTANSTTPPGEQNTLVGPAAGNATMTGRENAFIGAGAGLNNTTGKNNTFLGSSAGSRNTVGNNNTFLGWQAGSTNSHGNDNTVIGYQAGITVSSTSSGNTLIGSQAGVFRDGQYNTIIGAFAAGSFPSGNRSGDNNCIIGYQAGFTGVGYSNTFIGDRAGYNNSSNSNVFIGNLAGYNNTGGQSNMFLGPQAGSNNTFGNYNVFLGNAAANANTTGSNNTAIGAGSAAQNTTGERNTFIGEYAGFNSQAGNDNVFIGFASKAGTTNPTNLNNAVAIGANSVVSQDNSVILGNSISSVGIGNSAPKNKLEITQGTANQSGLRLTNLTSASPASLTNQSKFLTVNDQGDVVMASLNGSGRLGVTESLWERKGSFLQSLQGEAIIIGSKVSQTPKGYKLFVEDGILTEKVKVAVKNTAEWSDKVFAPSYSLRPLTEVAQYIDKHQHLPGVPSAVEVVEKGIDVAKMDAKLLEKIEELTLYSIQLEKTNQNLQEDVKSQQKQLQQQQADIDELKRLMKQVLEKK